jgi:hypothetical protein
MSANLPLTTDALRARLPLVTAMLTLVAKSDSRGGVEGTRVTLRVN